MSAIDPERLSAEARHKLLIGSVLPRPIAWTSTVDRRGVRNLAPFSFFTVVSDTPPMLSITMQAHHDPESGMREKDTLANVRATEEFVVNVVSTHLADAMWHTSHAHPSDVDEFAVAGLTAQPSVVVTAPRVRESLVTMECVLEQILRPGDAHVVIGRIVHFHVDDGLLDHRGRIDLPTLNPLARLGGTYAQIDQEFALPRAAGGAPGNPTGPYPGRLG